MSAGNGLAKSRPAWMERASSLVSDDDLSAILSKQVEKAKNGDDRAARFVLDFVGKQQQTPTVTNATQNVFHIHVHGEPPRDESESLRLKCLALVEHAGPLTAGQIAAQLGIEPDQVEAAVKHPAFKRNCHGVLSVVRH